MSRKKVIFQDAVSEEISGLRLHVSFTEKDFLTERIDLSVFLNRYLPDGRKQLRLVQTLQLLDVVAV